MKLTKQRLTLLTLTAAILFVAGILIRGSAQTTPLNQGSPTPGGDSTQVKIARAMSAGPMNVAKAARIIDTDAQGMLVVLREGSNGFTCMPGNLKVVGEPPMCVDAAAMQWYDDAKLTNRNRLIRSLASRTCWPVPLSAAIQIPTTLQACPSG